MTPTRVLVLCAECGSFWTPGGDGVACTEPGHEHQRFEVHLHHDVVSLPHGTTVTAVAFDDAHPYRREQAPDFGLYLDARWQPPWPHEVLDWPDFGVPADPSALMAALRSLRDRARAGEQVEIGCVGAHGRTGTALACLAVLGGVPADDAVGWVRTTYCEAAVETEDQAAFVAAIEP